jgi:hypothetical protein
MLIREGQDMMEKKLSLVGKIRTDNPWTINTALRKAVPQGIIEQTATNELAVQAELGGKTARDLNRSLLSALRRVEKKTLLRAEWAPGNVREKFFDYAPKGKTAAK